MGKYAELVARAQFACTILGNISTWDVLLLRCPYQPHDLRDQVARRGLRFFGVAAIVDGVRCSVFTEELCPELLAISSLAFAAEVESWLAGDVPTPTKPEQPDESIDWLNRLYALPDPRG